jgi:hypothetical protein
MTFLQTIWDRFHFKIIIYSSNLDVLGFAMSLASLEDCPAESFTARTRAVGKSSRSAPTRFNDKRSEDNWAIAAEELSPFEMSSTFATPSLEVELETFSLEVEFAGLNPATPFQFWMLDSRSRLIRRRRLGSLRRYCKWKKKLIFVQRTITIILLLDIQDM